MNPKVVAFDIYPKFLNLDEVGSSIDLVSDTSLEIPVLKLVANECDTFFLNASLYTIQVDALFPIRVSKEIGHGCIKMILAFLKIMQKPLGTLRARGNKELVRMNWHFISTNKRRCWRLRSALKNRTSKLSTYNCSVVLPSHYAKATHTAYIGFTSYSYFSLYYNDSETKQFRRVYFGRPIFKSKRCGNIRRIRCEDHKRSTIQTELFN